MRRTLLSAAIAAFLMTPALVSAETVTAGGQIGEDSVIRDFLVSDTHMQALARAAAVFDDTLGRTCEESTYRIGLRRVNVLEPITMDAGDPRPQSGSWSARFLAEQCDSQMVYNAILRVQKDSIEVTPLVPGESGFSAPLISEFLPVVPQLAQIENCETVYIANIVPVVPAGVEAEKPENGILETWAVQGCGREVQLVLQAEPGKTPADTRVSLVERVEVGD